MSESTELDFSFLDTVAGTTETLSPRVELAEGEIDPRFMRLSYSGSLDLHACPRLFQLQKLGAESTVDFESSVTFAFGHVVGAGIADLMITGDLDKTLWNMFLGWEPDFFAENPKQQKSLPHAVAAIQKLHSLMEDGLLSEYEVAEYNGKPAAELSFRIELINGFTFRGYLDLVLRRKSDGEKAVLECKTDSGNYVFHVKYKNSAQAVGYSVVLDEIDGELSSYNVEYLLYMTRLSRYENFSFPKSYQQRALWLRDTLYDVEAIQSYVRNEGNYGIWPMRGESCGRFNKPCNFLDVCHLPTGNLAAPLREIHYKDRSRGGVEAEYQFDLTLAQLLEKSQSQS